MGERLARRRAPDVLVHAAVPKTGSMTLIAHLNNASALSKVATAQPSCSASLLVGGLTRSLRGSREQRPREAGLRAGPRGPRRYQTMRATTLDAAYLFALRDPIHTAHSAASAYPLVYDDSRTQDQSGSPHQIWAATHIAALTLPVEKHVACADALAVATTATLSTPNAVTFARSRSGACATTLGEFAYARRDRLEAAKSALASLDAFVVMEDAGDAGTCWRASWAPGFRVSTEIGTDGAPVGIDAARRALYENATRLDAELYSFAREAHAHLAATVRGAAAARGSRARLLLLRLSSWRRRTGAWRTVWLARARGTPRRGLAEWGARLSGATRAWTRTASRASAGKW